MSSERALPQVGTWIDERPGRVTQGSGYRLQGHLRTARLVLKTNSVVLKNSRHAEKLAGLARSLGCEIEFLLNGFPHPAPLPKGARKRGLR
jgi:hypothetical protein